jgi:hypothetical protein
MPGGFTDIKLAPKVFRMAGTTSNPTYPIYIRDVTHPDTGERPKSLISAMKCIALWNERQSTYVFELFEESYLGFIPKMERIELRGKHQTTFELESEE